ncbi:helix-turn-helix domain-containing protein [Fictibacillus barbaricus]|uniref:Cytoskeletal protein RodZ n=1 Tax=Fictibacillus barbaricus TaxID=182136 RepID=A0ABU1TYC2_9BACL|nr:RodZ domain-containing protein [Fictibacillus barbaricus]MDR7072213.1 cytoskeletal protein RodZ [Fictibacillus barbaricus]
MTELGNLLKEKREEKGMSLEELQTATKIQKRYLVAIEDGNYDVLPGAFYARAFIKNYCEAVGLHYETIFEEYKHEIPQAAKEPSTEFEPRSKRKNSPISEGNSIVKRIVPFAIIALVIIAILLLVLKWLPDGKDEAKSADSNVKSVDLEADQEKPKKKEKADDADKKKDTPAEKAETPKQTLTKLQTSGIVTTYELKDTDKLVVDLSASGPSYVGIKDENGKSLLEKQLSKGEQQTVDLSAAKEVTLNIGAAHVTTIKINGEDFTYPVPPTERVHQKIVIKKVQ